MVTVRLLVVLSAAALAPAAALGVTVFSGRGRDAVFRTEVVKHRGSCYETNIQDAPNRRNQASESVAASEAGSAAPWAAGSAAAWEATSAGAWGATSAAALVGPWAGP